MSISRCGVMGGAKFSTISFSGYAWIKSNLHGGFLMEKPGPEVFDTICSGGSYITTGMKYFVFSGV